MKIAHVFIDKFINAAVEIIITLLHKRYCYEDKSIGSDIICVLINIQITTYCSFRLRKIIKINDNLNYNLYLESLLHELTTTTF